MAETLKNIPLELIQFNPNNLRTIPTEDIKELADSILFIGLLEPPVVIKDGDVYTLIAGERRVRACELLVQRGDWEAGASIKCIVRSKMTEDQQTAAILIENMQRVDLSPVEQARGVFALAQEHNLGEMEIASNLGVTRQWVKDRIAINGLPDFIKDAINVSLPVKHAVILANLPSDRFDRLTKDGKIPGQYEIETAEQKVRSEEAAAKLTKKMLKDGYLVTTEKAIKALMITPHDECVGNDQLMKAILGPCKTVNPDYWKKLDVPYITFDRIINMTSNYESGKLDKSTIYVTRKAGGFVEWAKVVTHEADGVKNAEGQVEEEPDEYDQMEERNEAKRKQHREACEAAEIDYIAKSKPAELINTILWGNIMGLETGFRSFDRMYTVAQRLGLEVTEVRDVPSLDDQRAAHVKNLNAVIAFAKKSAANLARAAATCEMVAGPTSFDVPYPDEPEYEEWEGDEEDDVLAVGF